MQCLPSIPRVLRFLIPRSIFRDSGNIAAGICLLLTGCRAELVKSPLVQSHVRDEFAASALDASATTISSSLQFGVGVANITPAQPTGLAGFGGFYRRLLLPDYDHIGENYFYFIPYTRVDLDPRAKVYLWTGTDAKNAQHSYAIVSIDLVAVSPDITNQIVADAAQAFPSLNLSLTNVEVVATHTHAGPAGLSQSPMWSVLASDRFSPRLSNDFRKNTLAAFSAAVANLAPLSTITMRRSALPGFNKTRITFMNVDNTQTHLAMTGTDGKPRGCIQIYAIHPVFFGQTQRVLSSDLSGHIEKALESQVTSAKACMFLNGAVGNADAFDVTDPDDYAKDFATHIITDRETTQPSEISFGSAPVLLQYPELNFRACSLMGFKPFVHIGIFDALPRTSKISYFKIGRIAYVFIPGEPVQDVADQISNHLLPKFPQLDAIQLLSTANDYLSYIVTADDYDRAALETCSSLYGKGLSQTLEDQISMMLTRDLH